MNSSSKIVKDRVNELIHSQQIGSTETDAIRQLISQVTDLLKQILSEHIKENYKGIIQVISYPKTQEQKTFVRSEALWNAKTDDVLSIEMESETWKFLLVIHGLIS